MKPVKTWILIADANRARILENPGPGKGLLQLKNKTFTAEEAKFIDDDRGRTFNSASPARHKMESNFSADPMLMDHIDNVFKALEASFSADEFDRLVICASPNTLGVMRERIQNDLQAVVIAEVPKDLTNIPTTEMASHFNEILVL